MPQIRYDGRVAIVTGSGGGLGRQYAEMLASRGAKVLINDVDAEKARDAAAAIVAAGGEALANSDSVEEGEKLVRAAVEAWGRLDILINNAGILRDAAFHRMTRAQLDEVLRVHLIGAYAVTRAAWGHMRAAAYGRVVCVTSVNGLYGAFGQSNYAAAKAALVGFAKTLAIEGEGKGIRVNAVAPGGGTQMTASVMPPELLARWKPAYAVPCVAYLCSEECEATGGVFEAGGGWMAQVRWQRSAGVFFDLESFSVEDVRDAWGRITDFTNATSPEEEGTVGVNSPQLAQILHGSKL
ncbi:hypothetical protein AB1Y20_019727 [Prymnesium parvum]|uniref:Ketoreductase domain-containing protein n=1 Tax=Prymnesium parvum TaxID=97485 RepID=A0AB34JV92_PRYPA